MFRVHVIDKRLFTLKLLHLNTLIQIFSYFQYFYSYFKTIDGESIIKSGFHAPEITNAIANAKQGNRPSIDPYIYR